MVTTGGASVKRSSGAVHLGAITLCISHDNLTRTAAERPTPLVNPRDATRTYPELHVESAQSRATPGCAPLSQAAAARSGIAATLTIPYPAS